MSDDGIVAYTVKELVARLDAKLDTIILTLAAKADKVDVDTLAGRVTAVENMQAQSRGSSTFVRWATPVVLSILALAVSFYAVTHV